MTPIRERPSAIDQLALFSAARPRLERALARSLARAGPRSLRRRLRAASGALGLMAGETFASRGAGKDYRALRGDAHLLGYE